MSISLKTMLHSLTGHLDNINLQTEWVMKVDADEEFTSELADEIDEKLDTLSAKVNGVILRRRVYFMGRWLKHGGKYPELLLRIFRVGHGMSEMKLMDEHLIVTDGNVVPSKMTFLITIINLWNGGSISITGIQIKKCWISK